MKTKTTLSRALLFAGMLIPLAACTTSPDRAYQDALVQIGQKKAGFKARRDPEALMAFAAENAVGQDDVTRYNRAYGRYMIERRKPREAYVAFERAALSGDESAARRLVKGHADGLYRPADTALIARKVYLPLAANKSETSVRLLLAELIQRRKISGREFRTANAWLDEAAAAGATGAFRQLAERAERSGNVALAASYYARSDKTSKSERALRQARTHYLGLEGRPNQKLGHAWLELARKSDKQRAGELAARIYRTTAGERDGPYLMSVAASAGVGVMSRRQVLEAYRSAKSDEDRARVLEPLIAASRKNDPNASYELASIYIEARGDAREINTLLAKAYAKGKTEALDLMIPRMSRADAKDGSAGVLFDAVVQAGEKGNVQAARSLSALYRIGGFKPADRSESLKWLKRAADAGDVKSQYELGVDLYENGDEQSKPLALKYLNSAADRGDSFAKAYLKSKT